MSELAGGGGVSDRSVETLPALPALGGLYAKGAVSSARIALGTTAGYPVVEPAARSAASVETTGPAVEPVETPAVEAAPSPAVELVETPGPEVELVETPSYVSSSLSLPSVVYQVERVPTAPLRERLREYQRLVHEPNLDVLPAGFLHILAFPLATAVMVRPDFPLPLLGMVHLANAASVIEPVRLGDELEVRAWAENLRPHRRGVQVDLVAEVWKSTGGDGAVGVGATAAEGGGGGHGAGQVLAYRGVSTYLAKGVSGEVPADGASDVVPEAQSEQGGLDWSPPHPTGRWTLPGSTGRAYGAVSGDRNPIHMSALSAKAFGFRRAIAHGMYTAARALAEVGPGRGDRYRWTVEFYKPVLLPSTVDIAITKDAQGNFNYEGWNARKELRHFAGKVEPLDAGLDS